MVGVLDGVGVMLGVGDVVGVGGVLMITRPSCQVAVWVAPPGATTRSEPREVIIVPAPEVTRRARKLRRQRRKSPLTFPPG